MMSSGAPPAFELPAELRSDGYALRPEEEVDIPFLMGLFASTREDELAPLGWTPQQKQVFLTGQFQAQCHHYRTYISDCRFDILEWRGEPVGRLYLEDQPTRLHIVDISLLPAWRGKGIGTALLEALIVAGRSSARSISIYVEKFNPALRLYRRLGFVEIQDTGVYLEMECPPEACGAVS